MRQQSNRLGRGALILVANVGLLIVLLLMIEGFSSYVIFLRDLAYHAQRSSQRHTAYDAEIGWVGMPNLDIKDMYGPGADLRTNGQGFRNVKDFEPKREAGGRRIVCSGDSVTFGEQVGNQHTFCNLLAELDPKLESINMGQVGYGVDQAYLWYRRDSEGLEVDVHVLAFITHDFKRMQYDEFMGVPRPLMVVQDGELIVANAPLSRSAYTMPPWLTEALNRMDGLRTVSLLNRIRKTLKLEPKEVPGAWNARRAEEVKAVLTRLFEDLRDYNDARSRTTVLVYLPSAEELRQPTAELADWVSFVESDARRLDIPFINFASQLAELPVADAAGLFVDGYHLSEAGNALVARKLLEQLQNDPRTNARLQ
jgi:hypothetical protein